MGSKELSPDKITVDDIEDYLLEESDFGFELQIVKLLRNAESRLTHSGRYLDPFTKMPREFDIRCVVTTLVRNVDFVIALAVECKNVRENFPLVVHTVPVPSQELVLPVNYYCEHSDWVGGLDQYMKDQSISELVHIDGSAGPYQGVQFVGKSMTQVGRTKKEKEIQVSDSEMHGKWTQAVHSAAAWLESDARQYLGPNVDKAIISAIPIVVVPEGRLWEARYDDSGRNLGKPEQVCRVTQYIGLNAQASAHGSTKVAYELFDIVTPSGLTELIGQHFREAQLATTFPIGRIEDLVESAVVSG